MSSSNDEINNDKQSFEFSNLESTMKLLQTINVPSNMQPLQTVALSTVQMFTASFLATIQSLTKQQTAMQQLTKRIEQLEMSSPDKQPLSTSLSTEKSTDAVKHPATLNYYTDKVESIEHRLTELENTVSDSESVCGAAGETIMKQEQIDGDRIQRVEHQLEIVTKKLTELVKRFKKEQSKKNDLSNIYEEIEATKESFSTTLINHENELEGIINTILEDISLNKEKHEDNAHKLKLISDKIDEANFETMTNTSERLSHLHSHMKKVISNLNHVKSFCKRQGMPSLQKKPKTRTGSIDLENLKKTLTSPVTPTTTTPLRERSRSSSFLTYDDTSAAGLPDANSHAVDENSIWLARPVTRRRQF